MLKTRIIASDVCSLTDARYFSAWGVDFLSFNCEPSEANYIDESTLQEIREWVEGPQIAGSFISDSDIEDQIKSRALDAVIMDRSIVTSEPSSTIIDKMPFVDLADIKKKIENSKSKSIVISLSDKELDEILEYKPEDKVCYLEVIPLDTSVINRIIDNGNYGLVLKGSAEEKVGFKSFDFLDDVYDLLMD